MSEDFLSRKPPKPDHRLIYGVGELNFGDLFLPSPQPPKHMPVLVFLHGGWWKNKYGLDYGGHLCDAFRQDGIVVWSIEYRRVGDPGGGYPGTFQDVAAGFDFLVKLAELYPLDLARIAVVGHSAGGHLAFWLAGRANVPSQSPLHSPQPSLNLRGVVALAGAVDLRATIDLSRDHVFAREGGEVERFMGGSPQDVPEHYRSGNPGELMPILTPQWLLQGTEDDQIPPELPERWALQEQSRARVQVDIISGADHYDLVDPQSRAWPAVRAAVHAAIGLA